MGDVFVGQTALKLVFESEEELTNVSSISINYQKPDLTYGSWNGAQEDNKTVSITFDDSNYFDQPGIWKLWVEIVFNDNKKIISNVNEILVKMPGE